MSPRHIDLQKTAVLTFPATVTIALFSLSTFFIYLNVFHSPTEPADGRAAAAADVERPRQDEGLHRPRHRPALPPRQRGQPHCRAGGIDTSPPLCRYYALS